MSDEESLDGESRFTWIPAIAALLAVVGLVDSLYLTLHHYTATPVPCSIIEGCETVLTSRFATFGDVPLAAFGALAYFTAFSLATFVAFGNRKLWPLFGVVTGVMAAFSIWLLYVQAFVIGAFCQFCLLSAATSICLFLVYLVSRFRGK